MICWASLNSILTQIIKVGISVKWGQVEDFAWSTSRNWEIRNSPKWIYAIIVILQPSLPLPRAKMYLEFDTKQRYCQAVCYVAEQPVLLVWLAKGKNHRITVMSTSQSFCLLQLLVVNTFFSLLNYYTHTTSHVEYLCKVMELRIWNLFFTFYPAFLCHLNHELYWPRRKEDWTAPHHHPRLEHCQFYKP